MRTSSLHVVSEADVYGEVLSDDIAIRNYLEPLKKHLLAAGATEMWINQPGELILEVGSEKRVIQEPLLTFAALEAFAQAIAVYSPQQQTVGASNPLLSATLPDGERVQIALPPAVEPGLVSMSIRIPSAAIIPLSVYEVNGAFANFLWPRPADIGSCLDVLEPQDRALAHLLSMERLDIFLVEAIRAKKNIAVVGDTGSGKTTLMKSMCQHIPTEERLITIEDVRELMLPEHYNRVHLLYSKSGQGVARITPGDLIAACMRMAPSRVLLAELRGLEAWDFLKLLTTGHSGSITSFHAESCALAFERFMFMAKENPEASSLSRDELNHLVRLTLDVVIHVKREINYDEAAKPTGITRYVDEVYFDPWAKRSARFGDKVVSTPVAHVAKTA